ncbi:MAG: O-antigen ligase family protein [Spirosomataceae bacterium]
MGSLWLLLLNIIVLPFSIDVTRSIGRIAAWVPFVIYTNYFVVYLFTRYTKDEAKLKLLQVFCLSYFYPVALMFAYGIMFQTENIYGLTIGSYRTNVLGWACAFFILTGFDLYANYPIPKWLRLLFLITVIFSLWGVVLTGSRSSYASLALGAMVLVLRSNRVSKGLKIAAGLCILGFAYYIVNSADSVVNLRASYAEIRQQRGEIRFKLAETATNTFLDNPFVATSQDLDLIAFKKVKILCRCKNRFSAAQLVLRNIFFEWCFGFPILYGFFRRQCAMEIP